MVKYCQRGDDVKKKFINLVTNWKYTWLGWMVTIYFILLQARFLFGMSDAVIHTVVFVDVAVLLMSAGRWWGSIIGVLWSFSFYAEYLYKCYLINYKGQIIYHNFNTLPITLIFMAYFIFMGWICFKENKGKLK